MRRLPAGKLRASPPSRGCGLKSAHRILVLLRALSPPSRGCGLKCQSRIERRCESRVTPFAGVWIEMPRPMSRQAGSWSPPSRGCGLKFFGFRRSAAAGVVTPFAGVWIEMVYYQEKDQTVQVTPFAGVWIEIDRKRNYQRDFASPPSRGCGLKCTAHHHCNGIPFVTPFAGGWIEIVY